ncbi:receptor-transporting protein 2-like [Rhinatrema bivittatum]|uniref:receptor-transporting protein 2-like n=1 Tax=Rhinatrema bivittatum TaxID=194408 RepID=UPI00112BF1E8|nr:receptor-transporting protein 2-like [Rhinatrema bivittatum]
MDLYIWNSILEDKLKKKGLNDPWTLALDDSIQPNQGWKRYTLQIFGRFRCSGCSRTWASAKIQILFHMKLETMPERRGWVKMRVFKQECKKCSGATFEEPEFLSENIEVALEKLVNRIQEKCYRDLSGKSTTSAFIYTGIQDGPHESAHCEACHLGLCDLNPQGQEPGSYSSPGKTMPASAPKAEKHRSLDPTPIRSLYNTEGLKEHQHIESAPQYKTKVYVSQSQKPLSSIYNSWRAGSNLQPISASPYNPSGSVNHTQKILSLIHNTERARNNLQIVPQSLIIFPGSMNQTPESLSSRQSRLARRYDDQPKSCCSCTLL